MNEVLDKLNTYEKWFKRVLITLLLLTSWYSCYRLGYKQGGMDILSELLERMQTNATAPVRSM